MYIDIDPGVVGEEAVIGTFKETGPAAPIATVRLEIDGQWQWCEVVGWTDGARSPAWVSPIEESGDGPALLVHGGNQGLRLRPALPAGSAGARPGWEAMGESGWWAEGFLILVPETERA